ncbi:ABC transporter ATP-binding protein [Lacrimispora sp.]|uniref:ABC transporter ATP-binding protein n=1 Tax=Lacrimispora sp. TaxID=2719234 RepID=UPI0028B03B41|nr:ABC transporter ATP-binding protein [Lacrimispora sp.]
MQSCITADKLSAGYNGISVFRDMDIDIPAGKITTLIGSNGSGKSTILKTMSRLIVPSGGAVYLEGQSIHSMPTKLVAQKLALLPQGAQTPIGITVSDLVEYGRFPHRTKLSGLTSKDQEIIRWALSSTSMTELADREMDQLSGGQRQRGWIAMALAQKTDLLFLDEPTTYLDISHQLEILQLLRKLNEEQGVTVVMVLHDLNHAIMFSDYLVAIKEGKKHSAGSPENVMTPQTLREVFDVEAAVIRHPVLDVPVCLPYGVRGQVFLKQNQRKGNGGNEQ